MALSAFVFSLMGLCVNVLAWNSSLTPWELVAFRGVTLWVLSAAPMLRLKLHPSGSGENCRVLILRGVMGAAASSCNFWALSVLHLSEASTLVMTAPIWAGLLAVPVLKERLGPESAAFAVVCFGGVLLVAR